MKKLSLIAALIVIFFTSCEKEILQQSNPEELVVVEAYLYDNEIVDDIHLTSLLTYGDEDTVIQKISDAEIIIRHNGIEYPLMPSDSAGFYYANEDLKVLPGETYEIEIYYFNKTATAETTVPIPPTEVSISQDTFFIEESSLAYDREYFGDFPDIVINWGGNEDGTEYFYILVENIELNPVDISSGERSANYKKITLPVQGNSYAFNPLAIVTQYGTHLIKVFRVNKEYADLYESMEQDSRDLNEPLTNITNGLGVFTGFSCDSLFLEVLPE